MTKVASSVFSSVSLLSWKVLLEWIGERHTGLIYQFKRHFRVIYDIESIPPNLSDIILLGVFHYTMQGSWSCDKPNSHAVIEEINPGVVSFHSYLWISGSSK